MPGALDKFITANGDTDKALVIREAVETGPAIKAPAINAISATALAGKHFDPLMMPVQGLIAEGLTLLCGAAKIGKSWFVLQMCAAVARGVPFLGRTTTPGPVLYLAYEDSERRLQARLRALGEEPGDNLQFDTNTITVDGGLLDALNGWIMNNPGARMVVIDTLQMARGETPTRMNMYSADVSFLRQIKGFADAHHVAVVMTHHLNKLKDVDDPFEKISGSTGLMATADTTILLNRKHGENTAELDMRARDVWGDLPEIQFEGGRWRVCDPAALAREKYEASPVVQAVKRYTSQETVTGNWYASYENFRVWAMGQQLYVGGSAREVHQNLAAMQPFLARHDGIMMALDKRRNNAMGVMFSKVGGNGA